MAFHKNYLKYFLLLLFFISVDVSPQLLPFRYYTTDNKLSHSTITAIFQDHKGYMWFGTLDGISIFDGIEFKNISKEDGLIDRTVTSFCEDSKKRIWIGTYAGLSIYENGELHIPEFNQELTSIEIWSVEELFPGEVWIATKGGGINIIRNNSVSYITSKDGLPSDTVNAIVKNQNDTVFIGTSNGLSIYYNNTFHNYTTQDGLPSNNLKNLVIDQNNVLWIGTSNGLSKFIGGKFYNYNEKDGLINNIITDMSLGLDGSLWVATIDGVSKFSNGSFKSYTTKQGLSSNIILSIFEDNENNIWFGTYNKGLNCLLNEEIIIYRKDSGLISNTVNAIVEDKNGYIWFGTSDGITVYDGVSVRNITTENGLVFNDVWALFRDSNNNIWIGTRKGISLFDGKKINSFNNNDKLNDLFIFSIFEDSKNNIWFSSTNNGLFRYDGISFEHFKVENGLNINSVYAISEDPDNNIWIGYADGTFSIFDGNNFNHFHNTEIEFPGPIYSMQFDKNGYVWYSDFGNGIVKYKEGNSKLYSAPEYLPANTVVSLNIDNDNAIWAGTNKGIALYKENHWKRYNTQSGLISNEATYNSGYVDKNGNFWIGTMRGAVKFVNVKNIKPHPAPPVYITRFQVFEKDTLLIEGLELNHQQNFLRFSFTGICFKSPEEIEYRYKMNGLDNNWHTSKHRFVNYASLPPGEYEFIVNARNQAGDWSEHYASFSFRITPPFYNTIWFRIVFIIIASGLLFAFFRVKTVAIKKRNEELELIVNERTKQLEQERNKAEELLHNILPAQLVKELKDKGNTTPREYKSISILFTDFSGFTKIAAELPPEKLVEELNELFKEFDNIIEKHGLEKLKTVGDSYLIGGGLPVESDDHAYQTVKAAIAMQNYLSQRNEKNKIKWNMRVGINSGQVIAGIVGGRKFTYDVWGNTVNIANALQNVCQPGNIYISESTYNYIKRNFQCEFAGNVDCKGHGEIASYIVRNELTN